MPTPATDSTARHNASKSISESRLTRASLPRVGWKELTLLIVLMLVSFGAMLGNDLLWSEYDEVQRSAYSQNSDIHSILTVETLGKRQFFDGISYLMEASLPLPLPQLHRGINLLLHLSAALLFFRLLRNLKLRGARFAGLIFALHPAVIQTLFWPGYRAELLGLILILGALNCGIPNRSRLKYLTALVLTSLACMVHSAGIFIPVILVLLLRFRKTKLKLPAYNRILPVACVALLTATWIQSLGIASTPAEPASLNQAINHAGQNLAFFYKQGILPFSSALFYPYDHSAIEVPGIGIATLPFILLFPAYLLILLERSKTWSKGLFLGLTTFLLLLIPALTSYGVNIDGSPAHESHGLYLALPAIIALLVIGSRYLNKTREFGTKGLWSIGIGLVIGLEILISSSFSYTLGNEGRLWQRQSEQWPNQSSPTLALIRYAQENDDVTFNNRELIFELEGLLKGRPELINERRLLARTYAAEKQHANAAHEYTRILRESNPEDAFLLEAATFFDALGMSWEANKARQRINQAPAID